LWANAPAQIIGGLLGVDVPLHDSRRYLRYPYFGVVGFATNPEEIIDWLENADTNPPILFATRLFGADVLSRAHVKLDDGNDMKLIMMGHGIAFLDDYTTTKALVTKALNSLNEDHWFERMKVDDPDRRQKLVDAMKKHHVLRFVGGNPLPPDLDLDAGSVTKAISALGANVLLATIDLHGFKAEFLNENEVRHVLGPMEYLHKRKASEMDD